MHLLVATDIIFAVIAGSIAFFILAGFIISYYLIYRRRNRQHSREMNEFRQQFQHQLLQSQVEVQEQTFQQIGKDLHDNIGQLLSTSLMLLGLTERSLQTPPESLLAANTTLAQAIQQLRSLSKTLDKDWLQQFSFSDNLQMEVTRINAGEKPRAVLDLREHPPLAAEKQLVLFRIVQEAIQNAIRHGEPENIFIGSTINNEQFRITIRDDGRGFEPAENGRGMGLANMQHRTQLLGGSISWDSHTDTGTLVLVTLPINPDHNENSRWPGG